MKTINEIYKEIKQLRDSLEEYNGCVRWLRAGGFTDFENFEINEEDFEVTSKLVTLIADRLCELDNMIEAINIFTDNIDKLLDQTDKGENK